MNRILVPLLLLAGLAVGALYWVQNRPRPLVVSGFVEADEIRVGSRVGGRVSEVIAVEGQALKPGDVLYRIDPFDLREALAGAEARRAAAQAELDRLRAGFRPEEIAQARARRDGAAATLARLVAGPRKGEIDIARSRRMRAEANLELAQSEFNRVSALSREQTAVPIEIDRASRGLKAARAELDAASQELALLEEGTRKEDVEAARAAKAEADAALALMEKGFRAEDIARAEAQAAAAKADVDAGKLRLDELTVVAPTACVVEAITLRPGDFVSPSAPSVSLLDLSRLWVRAYVPELHLARVKLNEHVPIRIDGFGDRRFKGRIGFVAREGEFTPRNVQTLEERGKQVFRIKVYLEEGLDALRPGMAADVLLDEAR